VLLVLASLAHDQWGEEGAPRDSVNGRLLEAMQIFAEENRLEAEKLLDTLKRGEGMPDPAEGPAGLFRNTRCLSGGRSSRALGAAAHDP